MLPAVSLSYEKAETDIMRRKPRDPLVDRLINTRLLVFAYLQLGMIEGLSTCFTYFVVMGNFGYAPWALIGMGNFFCSADKVIVFQDKTGAYRDTYEYGRTEALYSAQMACFCSYVICQWGALIVCKTRKLSLFQQGMNNWVLNIGLLQETCIVALLAYFPPFNTAFSTRPISAVHWTPPLGFFGFIIIFDEVRKFLIRGDSRISLWLQEFSYY